MRYNDPERPREAVGSADALADGVRRAVAEPRPAICDFSGKRPEGQRALGARCREPAHVPLSPMSIAGVNEEFIANSSKLASTW